MPILLPVIGRIHGDSVKRISNYSEQGFFRKEVLGFTQEKAKAFSFLFVLLRNGDLYGGIYYC